MAEDLELRCGANSLYAEDLENCLQYWGDMSVGRSEIGFEPGYFISKFMNFLGSRCWDMSSVDMLAMHMSMTSLEDLITKYGHRQCYDPRDKVYGLLGLDQSGTIDITPDYNLSVAQAYHTVALGIIHGKLFLDGLFSRPRMRDSAFATAEDTRRGISSWIPDFADHHLKSAGMALSPETLPPNTEVQLGQFPIKAPRIADAYLPIVHQWPSETTDSLPS